MKERAQELVGKLSQSTDAPVLVVLDNVQNWSGDTKPQPIPVATALLVTTRQRKLGGSAFQHHQVEMLQPPADADLVRKVAGRQLAELDGLLECLGGHALALELAGAYLANNPLKTPAQYLKALQKGGAVEQSAAPEVCYQRTVEQAFKVTWDQLDGNTRNAWQLASCFEPEPVSRELSESACLKEDQLNILYKNHLIGVSDDGRWQMHRLTRAFGQRSGTDGQLQRDRQSVARTRERVVRY